jgi:hypothetical protein
MRNYNLLITKGFGTAREALFPAGHYVIYDGLKSEVNPDEKRKSERKI